MATIRSFIALPSNADLNSRLIEVQRRLMEERASVKWDTPDKFHITLKFLGDVDADRIPALIDSLAAVVAKLPAFSLVYDAIGAFPDLIHPKVIWAGARPNDALTTLHRELESACERLGFSREARAFHPHITLGRVKGPANLNRLTAKVKSSTLEPTTTHCPEILLIRSDLRPAGSVYTTLRTFPLNA
ncbi:MAG TPA: RNA 2',3'-cyclic phosphodiesterase [Bacteroidota bacterium]|nr:RNA 2',3'-cyclic phosphodiesterase [Bacteroidota bacterium]